MNTRTPTPQSILPTNKAAQFGRRGARWLLSAALLLTIANVAKAQPAPFLIATNSTALSYAFDGTNYLVAVENPGSPNHTVGAQLISSTGAKVGSLIPTGRTGIAGCVAFDGNRYLLIWEDNEFGTLTNESYEVFGQFVSTAGAVVGSPFNISGLGIQFDGVQPMAYGGGSYLVTYTRLIDSGGGNFTRYIAGRMVGANGTVGSEFRISTGAGKASDVAFDGANFFVVWCEDSLDQEIRGRFVSPAGVAGSEISVNASPDASDNPNSVIFGGTNYLVVWNDETGGKFSQLWDCFGQLVSTNGALVGDRITLTTEPGPQMVTGVAFDGARYMAVWADMQNGTNWDMYGQYISANGSRFGDKITISTEAGNQLGGVGFMNGKYLVVVNNGVVLGESGISGADSATGLFLSPPSNPKAQISDPSFGVRTNRFGFTITGVNGLTVVVDAATNLTSPAWFPVSTNVLTGGSTYFNDPQWSNYPGRFYRLRWP